MKREFELGDYIPAKCLPLSLGGVKPHKTGFTFVYKKTKKDNNGILYKKQWKTKHSTRTTIHSLWPVPVPLCLRKGV